MARLKKDRTEEVNSVFNNLKFCNIDQLKEVIVKANNLIESKKEQEIEERKKLIERLQKEVENLQKK